MRQLFNRGDANALRAQAVTIMDIAAEQTESPSLDPAFELDDDLGSIYSTPSSKSLTRRENRLAAMRAARPLSLCHTCPPLGASRIGSARDAFYVPIRTPRSVGVPSRACSDRLEPVAVPSPLRLTLRDKFDMLEQDSVRLPSAPTLFRRRSALPRHLVG